MGENPMLSDPDLHHVKDELKKLDLMICPGFIYDGNRSVGDVVLPVPLAEKDGTFSNTERRVQRDSQSGPKLRVKPKPTWKSSAVFPIRWVYAMKYASAKEIFEEVAK